MNIKRFYLSIPILVTLLVSACAPSGMSSSLTSSSDESSEMESEEQSSEETSVDPWSEIKIQDGMNLLKDVYYTSDVNIDIYVQGYIDYRVGIGTSMGEPGGPADLIKRKLIKEETNIYSFPIEDLKGPGEYHLFIYHKNLDIVEQMKTIKLCDDDLTDYKISDATLSVEIEKNIFKSHLEIDTVHSDELTYQIYWANNGNRLDDYMPIKEFVLSDQTNFRVDFKDGMYAPKEANQIEITTFEGRTTSFFVDISQNFYIPESQFVYEFQTLSDVHIESYGTCSNYNSHFVNFLRTVKDRKQPTEGVVFVGDFVNSGSEGNYKIFNELVDMVYEENNRPNFYYSLGNHEHFYYDSFEEFEDVYFTNTGNDSLYFSFEINGNKCFSFGNDVNINSTHGEMSEEQFNWFKEEIAKVEKDEIVYVFMHQGIYNTVSGTLPGEGWHGFRNHGEEIREILKEYPNAFVFSGHNHQSLYCERPALLGNGEEANFFNTGSCAYTLDDARENSFGSNAYFLEVYEDYTLVRGRENVDGKWIPNASYLVPRY